MPRAPSSATLAELKDAVGPGNFLDSPDDLAPYLTDFRRLYQGAAPSGAAAAQRRRGRSNPAYLQSRRSRGGAARRQHQLLRRRDSGRKRLADRLSLQRLNRVRQLDAANYSMIVEVGLHAGRGANGGARCESPLSLEPGIGRHGTNRRQPLHQCRRHGGLALRDDARPRAGPGGGARRRPGALAR